MADYSGSKVTDIFDTMPARFQPEAVAGVDVCIGYEITGEGGGYWTVDIKNSTLTVKNVEALPKCSVVLISDGESFVGGALGKIDPAEAFVSGKIKVEGDITILGNVLPKAFEKFTPVVRARSILESMPARFLPGKAEGVDLKIGYELSGSEGGAWTMTIKNNTCSLTQGLDGGCQVVMRMAAEVFTGLNTGKVDPATAFSSGQVRVDGDLMAAGATAKLFAKFEVSGGEEQGEELICLKVLPAIHQRFATGPYMGKWFAGLKEKKFIASKCPQCGRTQVPAREVCPKCTIRASEWVEVGPKATVTCIDHVYYASPDPLTGKIRKTPYAGVFMVLDGCTPDESFAHELNPTDYGRIKPGMRVRPVWARECTGCFDDLPYFEIDD